MLSKLSQKGQVTIPKAVRDALGLEPGDLVSYEIEDDGKTFIRRVDPFDAEFHAALENTLDEWNSPEDEEAFNDL
jgi:AbrB family looped-hinge helix DNA binding protein